MLQKRKQHPHQQTKNKTTTKACLRDLQRFLRRDDGDTRDAFFKLVELRTAEAHLLPLLVTYPEDGELSYAARE